MNRVQRLIRRFLFTNVGWKLLSVAVAFVLWVLVASEPEMSLFATAPVLYKNMPNDFEFSSEPVTSVSLELRGPSASLRALGSGEIHPQVILDMSGLKPGQRTFAIAGENVRLDRGIRLVSARPSEVRLEFEPKASRSVPVEVRFAGQGENGYVVSRYEVNPRELRITGPQSHVAGISSVVTDPLDVSDVVGTSEFRINAFVADPFVRLESAPRVAVSVTMRKR